VWEGFAGIRGHGIGPGADAADCAAYLITGRGRTGVPQVMQEAIHPIA